jgi:hypothetical protein
MEMMIDFVDERAILFLAVGTKVGVGREKANVSKTIRQPESLNETSFKGMRSKGYCSLKIRINNFSSVRKNHAAAESCCELGLGQSHSSHSTQDSEGGH